MTHIFIASRFSNWVHLCPIRDELQRRGHQVHSRWLDRAASGDDAADDPGVFALEDETDVLLSNLLIIDTSNGDSGRQRGGLYVEMGMALFSVRHSVWVVGPRTNVHTYHPKVRHFETWEEALAAL